MKKSTTVILIVTSVLTACICGAAIHILNSRTANSEAQRIYLPEGTTFEALCDSVNATKSFLLMAQALKLDERVRPGSYVIEPHMNVLTLVRKLRNGQQDPIRVTIGKFRLPQQINEYLNQKLMHDDFNITLDSFYIIRPDTYEFYWTVTPEQFMQRMRKQYDRENLDEETIILASIIEEETNDNGEKPLIASVYINRLRRGMPLQADPTVKYAVGDFTLRRILNKHLAVESPFNTYLHTGLPPAPICLPSKASVDAVLNAPETGYLYFCASEQLDGTHRFATTLAEHNHNAAQYHKAICKL